MPAQTYESDAFREWLGKVNALCIARFGKDIYHLRINVSIGEAFEDGATPEEFVTVDMAEQETSHPR